MDKSDTLAGLVDIPLPPVVSLWPQTWPFRIAIVVLIAGLIAAAWWFVHTRRANRYRRAALAELDAITQTPASLALLIRRTTLAAFPRDMVVALSGTDWLAFLDRTYGGTGFSQGPGRMLAVAPYALPPEGEGAPKGRKGDVRLESVAAADSDSAATSPFRRFAPPSPSGGRDDAALLDLVRRWIRTHHA